jgi:hypothetical protein
MLFPQFQANYRQQNKNGEPANGHEDSSPYDYLVQAPPSPHYGSHGFGRVGTGEGVTDVTEGSGHPLQRPNDTYNMIRDNAVEPPNKGHFGTMCFVFCIEVVLFSEVQNVLEL